MERSQCHSHYQSRSKPVRPTYRSHSPPAKRHRFQGLSSSPQRHHHFPPRKLCPSFGLSARSSDTSTSTSSAKIERQTSLTRRHAEASEKDVMTSYKSSRNQKGQAVEQARHSPHHPHMRSRTSGVCYRCHRHGHWACNCPELEDHYYSHSHSRRHSRSRTPRKEKELKSSHNDTQKSASQTLSPRKKHSKNVSEGRDHSQSPCCSRSESSKIQDQSHNRSERRKRELKSSSFHDVDSNDTAVNINDLPDEMLLHVFSYISHNELGRISRVSKKWNKLTMDPMLWKKADVKLKFSADKSINEVLAKFFEKLTPFTKSLKLEFAAYSNEPLNIEEFCLKLQEKCPALEILVLYRVNLPLDLHSAIKVCVRYIRRIDILIFYSCKFLKPRD